MMDYDEDFADEVWYSTNSTRILESSESCHFLYVKNFFVSLKARLQTSIQRFVTCRGAQIFGEIDTRNAHEVMPCLTPTFGWLVHVNMLVLHVCICVLLYQWSQIATTRMWRSKKDDAHDMRNGPLCMRSFCWLDARFVAWLPCIIMYHQFCVRLSKPGEIACDGVQQTMKESIAHRPLLFSIVTSFW